MNQAIFDTWHNTTTIHPIALLALMVASVAVLITPRAWAIVPIIILVCFVSPAQRVVVATLDFNFLRLLTLVAWVRILARGEYRTLQWKTLDLVVLLWSISAFVTASMLAGTTMMVINRAGYLFDAVGLYFMARIFIRDLDDITRLGRAAAILAVPLMAVFLLEKATGRNVFAIFGGVPEITAVRNGRLRCQGPFAHSILAGAFWASLLPLIAALWWRYGWDRVLATCGSIGAVVIIWTTSSATPINGLLFGCIAACLFPIRHHLGWIRLAACIGILMTHFVMLGPIWAILARMNIISGATGWYRYKLFDDFFMHFSDWWLIGTNNFETWWYGGRFAITSEYVLHGVRGGLPTLLSFLAVITVAFVSISKSLRDSERPRRVLAEHATTMAINNRARTVMIWAVGAAMFMHCMMFVGVSYFSQAVLAWFITLACAGSVAPAFSKRTIVQLRPRRTVAPA